MTHKEDAYSEMFTHSYLFMPVSVMIKRKKKNISIMEAQCFFNLWHQHQVIIYVALFHQAQHIPACIYSGLFYLVTDCPTTQQVFISNRLVPIPWSVHGRPCQWFQYCWYTFWGQWDMQVLLPLQQGGDATEREIEFENYYYCYTQALLVILL